MNYIGSKQSLLTAIRSILVKHGVPLEGIALDMFAGTCAVAQCLKQMGYTTWVNDWQSYTTALGSSYILLDKFPSFSGLKADKEWNLRIKEAKDLPIFTYSSKHRHFLKRRLFSLQVLRYLNQLPGQTGLFVDYYCDGGHAERKYFSHHNGCRIQTIRDQIMYWKQAGLISDLEENWLVACLLEAADRVANTASVYGAFLKHIKRAASKHLDLVAIHPIRIRNGATGHQTFCVDALDLPSELDKRMNLVYIDPPYNQRQYASNYHILETLTRWDLHDFTPKGKTGLRPVKTHDSTFCHKRKAYQAFDSLFKELDAEYILFSYNNEGLLSEKQLRELFETHTQLIEFKKIKYKRFRADKNSLTRNYKGNDTEEYLVLGKKI